MPSETPPEEAARQRVLEQVAKLGLDFRLEEHPELWERLIETGEHLEDAICMARMVGAIWPKLDIRGMTREKLMLCALLHDIGKSGPETKSPALRAAIKTLFATPKMPFNPFRTVGGKPVPKTVAEFMRETETRDPVGIRSVLAQELGVDVETKPMLEFWRDHADWTYEVLQRNRGGAIDDEVVVIAATHHILEGRNPARVPLDDIHPGSKVLELMERYGVLAVIDKYQAFRGRGGLDHAGAIAQLRKIVDGQKDLPDKSKEDYRRVIAVLESSEEELTKAMIRE